MKRSISCSRTSIVCGGFALLYLLLLSAGAIKHSFWRDESQAWLIARDSPTLASLFHNTEYEGHPPLWHLLLYAVTRFSWNPDWMKGINLLLCTATAATLASYRRFSPILRISLLFGYFFLFEYGIIVRNYMLGIALLLPAAVWIAGRSEKKGRGWAVPILLSLAVLSSIHAMVLALGLLAIYAAHECGFTLRAGRPSLRWPPRATLAGLSAVLLCATAAAGMVRPPSDSTALLRTDQEAHGLLMSVAETGKTLAKAYLPIPVASRQFWNQSYYDELPHHLGIGVDLAGWLLFALLGVTLRSAPARTFFLAGSAALLTLLSVSGRSYMRHIGWLFVCFVLALVIDHADWGGAEGERLKRPAWQNLTLGLVLATQAYAGLFALTVSLIYPFSKSQQVADFLRVNKLDAAPLVFEPDFVGSSVLAYLRRPAAYDLEQGRPGSFVIWNRSEVLNQHIPSRSELQSIGDGVIPVLIVQKPLEAQMENQLGIHLLAAYDDAINPLEHYYIYH